MIKARVASIFVSDQKQAEVFYTQVLGFVKKADKPLGEHRWLTVGDQDSDFELELTPLAEFLEQISLVTELAEASKEDCKSCKIGSILVVRKIQFPFSSSLFLTFLLLQPRESLL